MTHSKQEHIEYQKRYFDKNYEVFRQPIPSEIEERTRMIVQRSGLGENSRVLDVGTGIGVLLKHFTAAGVSEQNITGCDLSENMLAEARTRYPQANFWHGDFAEFPSEKGPFDAVFFNACFGNFFDRDKTVEAATKLLEAGGRLIISHPLGNKFVSQLQEQDPKLIVELLPDQAKLQDWSDKLGLKLVDNEDQEDLYLAVLQKNG